MMPERDAICAVVYVGVTLGNTARICCAWRMLVYSCDQMLPLVAGIGSTPRGYSTVRGSVLVNTAPSREYPAATEMKPLIPMDMSIRDPANNPLSAFWTPAGEGATDVGAVRNGTLLSLHGPRVVAPIRPSAETHRMARELVCVMYMRVMSEPQVEAKVEAASGREWRHVVATSDGLVTERTDLRIETVIVEDREHVVAFERETGAAHSTVAHARDQLSREGVAHGELADLEERRGLDVRLLIRRQLGQPRHLSQRVGTE